MLQYRVLHYMRRNVCGGLQVQPREGAPTWAKPVTKVTTMALNVFIKPSLNSRLPAGTTQGRVCVMQGRA